MQWELVNADREGIGHLSPAEQCRQLHIYPGHVLERVRDGRSPIWVNEGYAQRVTLLWLGTDLAVWSSQSKRSARDNWGATEETQDVDLRDDWVRVERGQALQPFAWSDGYGISPQTDSFAHVGRILVWVRREPSGVWLLDSVPFYVSRRLDAQTMHEAQREAEDLMMAALYSTLRAAGVDIGGPEALADAAGEPTDCAVQLVAEAA